MNNEYTIKNFRVFDEDGVTIPIKPITILTGCNSSGKSSIVKSMVLFDTYLKGLFADFKDGKKIDLHKHKLDFSTRESSSLGGFDRVLHNNTSKPYIEFSYIVHPLMLGKDVKVTYRFCTDKHDALNNGYIQGVAIETLDGRTIANSITGDTNYNIIIDNFFWFVHGQYVNDQYKYVDYNDYNNSYYSYSLDEFNDKYKDYAIVDIEKRENLLPKLYHSLTRRKTFVEKYLDGKISQLEYAEELGTLFFLPILKKLFPKNKGTLKKLEDELVNGGNCNEYVKNVFLDFYSSSFDTFGDYYLNKEHAFLKSNRSGNWNLTAGYRLSDDNIASEIVRYDNPTIDFIKVYDAIKFLSNSELSFYDLCSRREAKIFEMFKEYLSQVLEEVHTISMPHNLSYIGSSLVNIKRLYSLEISDSFTNLLKNYLSAERAYSKSMEVVSDNHDIFHPGDFMNKWLHKFGLGDSIKIHVDETQTGVTIRLFESKKDKKGSLLCDQGYGVTQLFVILLRIETAILESQKYCDDLDFGYSTDPAVLSTSSISYVPSTIAIEEPEVHQHPKFQSMLADLFVDAYKNYNVHFIIETHSEYLIRKLQNLVAQKGVAPNDISIVYVYDVKPKERKQGPPQINTINILSDGRLSDSFGKGFFDEADNLAMNLLYID